MSESEQRSLRSMRAEVDNCIQQSKIGCFLPLGRMARLAEKAGELACEVSHYYGKKQEKADEKSKTVSEGLEDAFFVLTSMANSLEVDLTEAFEENMAKFNKQDRYRFERKDGKTHD